MSRKKKRMLLAALSLTAVALCLFCLFWIGGKAPVLPEEASPVQIANSQGTGSQETGTQTGGTQTTDTQETGTQTTDIQTTDTQTGGIQTTEKQTAGTQATGKQTAGTQTTGKQTTGTQTTSKQTTGTTASSASLDLVDTRYTNGLSNITRVELYQNGSLANRSSLISSYDNKVMYYTDTVKRVINYPDGYMIDIPLDWQPDYSLSPVRVRYSDESSVLTVTKEKMSYAEGYDFFLEECFFRHIKNSTYLKNNRITVVEPNRTEQYGSYTAKFVHLRLEDVEPGTMNDYSYCILYNPNDTTFFFFMLKSVKQSDITPIVKSFQKTSVMGKAVYNVSYTPVKSSSWSAETKAYYEKLCSQDEVDWGIFTNGLKTGSLKTVVPGFEEKTGYTLPVIADYIHITEQFPLVLARNVSAQGRVFMLSLQYTDTNNTALNSRTAALEVYRGNLDSRLRLIARQIKAYGQPMILRLNNEMNTDWTSYGGLVTMLDPDIFIAGWERLYRIFEEEGVTNCIWVFNPTGGSYPPCNWANYLNYMPPSEHVHMLGLTEYVSGHSGFPSFESIYTALEKQYLPFYGDYPWIIGEFACGTGDGTKLQQQATWVTNMFHCLASKKLPNIKVAIWFSGNDYNSNGSIQNEYAINQNNALLMKAFREGFALTH